MLSALTVPAVGLAIGLAAFLLDRFCNFDAKDLADEEKEFERVEARLKKIEREIAAIRSEENARKTPPNSGPLASAH